jgi:V8-like Glu-specific endopeptidase
MSKLRLGGVELGVLSDLLRRAFIRVRFEELLRYRLNQSIDELAAPGDDYRTAMRKTLDLATADLWWKDLLREARFANPADADLQAFAEDYGLSPQTVDASTRAANSLRGPALQLKIKESQSTYNIVTWRKRLGEIEGRVCRIEYPAGQARGTGILVGPNAVLTNFHVVEPISNGTYTATSVVLRFDYKVQDDGVAVSAGIPYSLADEWLFASSPYSPHDLEAYPTGEPNADQLDFAILRVQGTPANDPVGGPTADPTPVVRRWLESPGKPHDFAAQPALYIVQHPDGLPMQVAIDSNAIVGVNGNKTRIRYTTTTQPGSSGSPCFGPDWDWVAIHHSGDPKYPRLGLKPAYNEGIPLPSILKFLQNRDKQHAFGGLI